MLLEISIKNFAIIEEISLHFEQGMTVLTGETGAGKSIIIDAMNMMLGSRATFDVIRHGAKKAEIEGLFSIEPSPALEAIFAEQGLDVTDELIIRREILQNGRSVSRINGQMVNLSVLRAVGQHLVDIHGQHDQEELMRAQLHIAMLDEFGDEDFANLKAAYQATFERYRTLRKEVLTQQKNQLENKARIEMLEYQMAEIEAADLKTGEDLALQQEREKLFNHKQIADTLTNAYAMLNNEEFSSLANVRSAMNDLDAISDYDPQYKDLSTNLSEGYYVLEDVSKRLEDILDGLDFDGNRLMQLGSRLDLLNSITRKYGGQVDDVLTYYEQISREYNLLTGNHLSSEDLEKELKEREQELVALAQELSQARHSLAQTLEAEIKQELQDLYMEKANFQVKFSKGKFNREGNEQVEFYISTNPGEEFKPLVKVASGGELSRLMLAIKSAFSRKEGKTSIVFDEVDTGVSGRVAQAIAQKIHKIGANGQVLAISHLPQVIAIADYQFFIEKISDEHSTVSTVRLLNFEERVTEVAKMLAGENVTEAALTQARELLRDKSRN
ncbi:DNA repair protein RecN [Streptococcus massiliensis]|uniref:DNA repair protein RecN n=2 Tax=Streptococcus massiliensis TaxID=313439 RepID=A0A380KVD7_9STRE|nr:DNA repair protein RecN [Streptococcus massiliensis]SUN75688.1 DNA repair protein RecN [Streptococcus massiliensis]